MGVLDFLSDLSKASRKDELGLGGMRSLLGTRGAAPEGKRGDEMMSRTSSDSLPGYFDPQTREYVPWYVDLFDGGGLNKSEGLLSDAQKVTTAVDMLDTNGAPVQRASQMAPGSDMPNTSMTGIPGYTLPQSDMPNTGMTGIPGYTLPQAPASLTPDPPVVRDKWSGRMFVDERGKPFDTELWQPEPDQPGRFRGTDYERPLQNPTITMPQEPTVPFLIPAQSGQSVPASGGNMAINTPAAQGRDQMIADQIDLQQLNKMQAHPLYYSFTQSPFGEGDKKYYPAEFFKYLQYMGV